MLQQLQPLLGFLFIPLFVKIKASDPALVGSLQQRITHRRGYIVPLNTRFTLSCPFETPFYKWSRPEYPSHLFDETKNVTIMADSLDISGRYQCSAVNGFGNSLAEMAVRVIETLMPLLQPPAFIDDLFYSPYVFPFADFSSPDLKKECALTRDGNINEAGKFKETLTAFSFILAGPCFLHSYADAELLLTRYWGEDALLDCSSVTADGRTYQLNYAWEFYKQGHPPGSAGRGERTPLRTLRSAMQMPTSNAAAAAAATAVGPIAGVTAGGVSLSPGTDVARFSDAQLPLRKVTLNSAGEYRCSVTNPSPNPSVINVPKITRKFRLHVIPRSEGVVIEGEHEVSVNVKSGDDLIQACRVNAEQHRSVTIRWGKTIDTESGAAERNPDQEVIRFSNMAFVVFPSVSASDIRNNPDTLPNPVAVSEPGSSESRLLIRKATIHDSGLYICSVLTESGRDDRKLVRVSIKGELIGQGLTFAVCPNLIRNGVPQHQLLDSQAQGMKDDSASNFPHRLTLYIAAPVAVFLICLSVICYCLISRHTRRTQQLNGNSYARATLPSGQQRTSARPEHASAVSNNSMGAYRAGVNGKTVLTPNSNAPLDHRAHSTQGKNLGSPVANPIIYSSSTGSHSLSGASTSTPGSMLLANTIVQVMPPDGSGYPMMKPNGHPHNGCPAVTVTGPHEHYNSPGMMYVPTGMTGVYHDYSGQQVTQQAG
ncbi:unnamed protein product [Schistocephalus solidus]|uniref:Ig-like domain-containing protein n=2 Tax=Schistocephalus solidus TaxID=70667 RepID=A0A183STM1_SCHSO|nr:unnamed protein product [Schistocephalus solidus]